jgi:hypothetical protein
MVISVKLCPAVFPYPRRHNKLSLKSFEDVATVLGGAGLKEREVTKERSWREPKHLLKSDDSEAADYVLSSAFISTFGNVYRESLPSREKPEIRNE